MSELLNKKLLILSVSTILDWFDEDGFLEWPYDNPYHRVGYQISTFFSAEIRLKSDAKPSQLPRDAKPSQFSTGSIETCIWA